MEVVMFDRIHFKKAARTQLAGHWKYPLLVSLIMLLLCACFGLPELLLTDGDEFVSYSVTTAVDIEFVYFIFNIISIGIFGILILAATNFFLEFSRNREIQGLNSFFEGVGMWFRGMLAGLWYWLWIILWGLLFIIPGIVKMFSYSMMFFILAEHPGVSVRKAMRLSRIMTHGYKGDLFVMQVSFIGWIILAAIPCGIGFLWLLPYMQLSYTHAYRFLKAQALTAGVLRMSDFEESE